MRSFIALLLMCCSVFGAEVTFHLSDFGETALASKKFVLTSLSTPRVVNGRIIPTDTREIRTDAAGDVTTNLVFGNYRVDLSGSTPRSPTTSFLILVPDTTDALDASDLIASVVTVPGVSVGYSQNASDARFVGKTNSSSYGQTLTNALFAGSTNAFRFIGGTAGDFLTTDGTNIYPSTVTPGEGLTAAVTSINGDTNAAQTIVISETGSDFGAATSAGATTMSLPIASASKTGKISSNDWSTFNAKQAALGYTPISNSSGTGTNTSLVRPSLSGPTFSGSITNTGVAASKILRTDSANVEAAVTVGSGLSFDGTTLISTGSGGSVTSVALSADSDFEITGSPITTSGTINIANTNSTGTGKYVRQTSPTLTTPTIASFANANHNHQDSAGGGVLAEAAITGLTADLLAKQPASDNLTNWSAIATTTKVGTNGTGFPALTGDITTVQGAVATTLKNTGTAGTYRSVTFDAQGRETSGTNPTTFSGYGLSDSSANLASALTDESGTGVAVFGTDPSLTRAALADATLSGSITNAWATATRFVYVGSTKVFSTSANGIGSLALSGVLNDETGTGSAVFGTAPTVSNPNFTGISTNGSGLVSLATDAAVNIAATGWTNTFGKNATVYFDGTTVTYTVFNNALTSLYTNAVAFTGSTHVHLQPSGAVTISGTGVTGRAVPF